MIKKAFDSLKRRIEMTFKLDNFETGTSMINIQDLYDEDTQIGKTSKESKTVMIKKKSKFNDSP